MLSNQRTLRTTEFARLKGKVYAPVHLTDDMSDYVKINKGDLIHSLRMYDIRWVRISEEADGAIIFIEGRET